MGRSVATSVAKAHLGSENCNTKAMLTVTLVAAISKDAFFAYNWKLPAYGGASLLTIAI